MESLAPSEEVPKPLDSVRTLVAHETYPTDEMRDWEGPNQGHRTKVQMGGWPNVFRMPMEGEEDRKCWSNPGVSQ